MTTIKSVFAIAALPLALSAQAIVVDPSGAGDYQSLQRALDNAPASATIKVIGGTYAPITVRRSVTILGNPTPRIIVPMNGVGAQAAGIQLAGGGNDRLTMNGVHVSGLANGRTYTAAGPALAGHGFSEVQVFHSTLHAADWRNAGAILAGAPGIDVQGVSKLVIVDSDVAGSDAQLASTPNVMNAPNGGDAVRALGATVILLTSRVQGGDGPASNWHWPPANSSCACSGLGGHGGQGVVGQDLFRSDSRVDAGAGGPVTVNGAPFGQQPNGAPIDCPGGDQLMAQILLHSNGTAQIGERYDVLYPTTRVPSALVFGLPAQMPFQMVNQWMFVDPGFVYAAIPLPMLTARFGLIIPDAPQLLGAKLATHLFDSQLRLSAPLLEVVSF